MSTHDRPRLIPIVEPKEREPKKGMGLVERHRDFFEGYAKGAITVKAAAPGATFSCDLENGAISVSEMFYDSKPVGEVESAVAEGRSIFGVLHEIEHILELRRMLQSEEKGAELFRAYAKKLRHSRAYATMDDIVADIRENRAVVSKTNAEMAEVEQGAYRERLFPQTDFTKLPKHLQFCYALIREARVPGESCVVSDDVRGALNEFHAQSGALDVITNPETPMNLRHELQDVMIWPIVQAFLKQDMAERKEQDKQRKEEQEKKKKARESGGGEQEETGEEGDEGSNDDSEGEDKENDESGGEGEDGGGDDKDESEGGEEGSDGEGENDDANENGSGNGESEGKNGDEEGEGGEDGQGQDSAEGKGAGKGGEEEEKNDSESGASDGDSQGDGNDDFPELSDEDWKNPNKVFEREYDDFDAKSTEAMPMEEVLKALDAWEKGRAKESEGARAAREQAKRLGVSVEELQAYERIVHEMKDVKNPLTRRPVYEDLRDMFARIVSRRLKPAPFAKYPLPEGDELIDPTTAHVEVQKGNTEPHVWAETEIRERRGSRCGRVELTVVCDRSDSMNDEGGAKAHEQRRSTVLVMEALTAFAKHCDENRAEMLEKLAIASEVYSFDGSAQDAIPLKPMGADTTDAQKVQVLKVLQVCPGKTTDYVPLRAIADGITPEMREQMQKGELKKIVFVFTDGDSGDAAAVRVELDKLHALGVIVVGIGITASGRSVLTTYAPHAQVAKTAELLPVVLGGLLKEHLEPI